MEKVNELSTGEKLIGGGGILMVIASFLPWYKGDYGLGDLGALGIDTSFTRNGWQSPGSMWSTLAVVIAVVMVGAIAAQKFGNVKLPDLGQFTWGQAMLAAGGLVAVCIVLKFLNHSSDMSFGFILGIIAAVALAAGGYLYYTESQGGAVKRL